MPEDKRRPGTTIPVVEEAALENLRTLRESGKREKGCRKRNYRSFCWVTRGSDSPSIYCESIDSLKIKRKEERVAVRAEGNSMRKRKFMRRLWSVVGRTMCLHV